MGIKKIHKRLIPLFILILLILVIGSLKVYQIFTTPAFRSLDHEMEYILSDFVKNDRLIHNSVLSVMKGDGSFTWSGAAGVADRDNQSSMTRNTPVYIASITKLYTAVIIMRLYEEQRLLLNDPASKYLSEKYIKGIHFYNGKDYSREITIRHLLSHASGIADYYTERPEGGQSLFEIFLENPERQWTADDTIQRARNDLKANFPPGTDVAYSDTNFQLLGKIIESITGKPLYIIFDEYIFHPLRLKHTWLVGYKENTYNNFSDSADVFYKDKKINKVRSNGSYWADGGIISTADEMIIFLKALNDGKIIRKDTLDLMHNWKHLRFPIEYGCGTMNFNLPRFMGDMAYLPPLWGHSGSTGSFLYYSTDHDLYIAGTINQVESESKPFFGLISKVIKAISSKE